MGVIENLKNEANCLLEKRIELEMKYYKLKYPDEEFQMPEIIVSFDFRKDAINIYKEFNYPSEYIDQLDKMANWDTTVALTINGFNMNVPSKIIVRAFGWRDDTILHELTHVSDYYGYCKRHNYLGLNYLEFLDLKEFICVYLFSEFRAFYRGALHSDEDLRQRLKYETNEFQRNQIETIDKQNLEAYYYHSIKYVGFYCAYFEKYTPEEKIASILYEDDVNIIHTLLKFLYPLRNKSFNEMETYINEFQIILDKMVSTS
ncbi:MAG: hypothetical protein NC548_50155 [Lachnospiraceae bacterium]|nr:hypothetical protein [Lachnospiraceae bacterium]